MEVVELRFLVFGGVSGRGGLWLGVKGVWFRGLGSQRAECFEAIAGSAGPLSATRLGCFFLAVQVTASHQGLLRGLWAVF